MYEFRFTSKDGSLQRLLNKFYHDPPTEPDAASGNSPLTEPKAPPFEPEPTMTPGQQDAATQRAALREMLYRLNERR